MLAAPYINMRPTIYGADIAINHGAIVNELGQIIYTYETTLGMRSSLEDLYQQADITASMIPQNSIVVIDWDRNISSWDKGKGSTGTFLTLAAWTVGIICRRERQIQVSFVSPEIVRKCLGLGPKTSKKEVHRAVEKILPKYLLGTKFHKNYEVRGDCKDAWLLAYTYNLSKDY